LVVVYHITSDKVKKTIISIYQTTGIKVKKIIAGNIVFFGSNNEKTLCFWGI